MNRLPFAERLDLNRYLAFRHRIPIRSRIALFGAAVVALTVIIFGVLVYVVTDRSLHLQQDTAIHLRGDQTWTSLAAGGGLARGP